MVSQPRLITLPSVWHRAAGPDAAVESSGFVVTTCQRGVSIGAAPRDSHRYTRHSGVAAYRLLLEISTGLASELAGETNVFGQIKRAWAEQRHRFGPDMQTWVQRWFADTKAIRNQFLQNVGGQSYASLCRRFLDLDPATPLAIVGGGDLAASMVSLFRRHSIGLFVRAEPRFEIPENVSVGSLAALPEHVPQIGALIVCIPANPEWERTLAAALGPQAIPIVHLGYRHNDAAPLGALANFHSLDALFALKREQDNVRSLKLAAAKRACAQRAAAFDDETWEQAAAVQAR